MYVTKQGKQSRILYSRVRLQGLGLKFKVYCLGFRINYYGVIGGLRFRV